MSGPPIPGRVPGRLALGPHGLAKPLGAAPPLPSGPPPGAPPLPSGPPPPAPSAAAKAEAAKPAPPPAKTSVPIAKPPGPPPPAAAKAEAPPAASRPPPAGPKPELKGTDARPTLAAASTQSASKSFAAPVESPAYWFRLYERNREVAQYAGYHQSLVKNFEGEFFTRDQESYQIWNSFLREHCPVPPTGAIAPKGESKEGKFIDQCTDALARVNVARAKAVSRFGLWQDQSKRVVASAEAFNVKLTAYNEEKKAFHKIMKEYLSTKKTAGKDKLDKALEKALKAKQTLESSRLEVEAALRTYELSKESAALQTLASSMSAQWEFIKTAYELMKPLEGSIQELNELSGMRAKMLNDDLATLRSSQRTWESASNAAIEKELQAALAVSGSLGDVKSSGPRDLEVVGLSRRTTETTKEGFLYHPTPGFARVFCTLGADGNFKVEATSAIKPGKPSPNCTIPIILTTAKELRDTPQLFAFTLISPSKTITLQAESQQDMQDWMAVIQNAIGAALQGGGAGSSSSSSSSASSAGSSSAGGSGEVKIGAGAAAAAGAGAGGDSVRAKAGAGGGSAALQALLAVDGNNQCADCDSMVPAWISLNLGIMMCVDCSGVHRSMGVSVSKVRSPTLDKLDKFHLALLTAIGNTNANNIWVGRYTNKAKSRPHRQSNREMRELWIRSKYETKKFLRAESEPAPSKEALNSMLFKAIAENKPLEVMKALAWGADPNARNEAEDNRTPLHQATSYGSTVCVDLLIQNNATVEPPPVEARGWTPLHYAAFQDDPDMAELLLTRSGSAAALVKDAAGDTPLDVARKHSGKAEPAVLALLTAAMEKENKRKEAKES